MKRIFTWILVVILTIGIRNSGSTKACTQGKPKKAVKITLLHTNDQHGRALEEEGMGLGKIATLKKTYKKKNPNTFLLDMGDAFHGTTFATLDRGLSMVEVMNECGYDLMVPGNHDFNYGKERLLQLSKKAKFPIISGNIIKENGKKYLPSYVIVNIEGIKVAFFGLTTPETQYKTHPDNVKGLVFEKPVERAKKIVSQLKNKAQVIICMAHLGTDQASKYEDTSIAIAKQVKGIDLILDGHSHSVLEKGMVVNGVTIVSSGEYNKNLGVVELVLSKQGVQKVQAKLVTKEEAVTTQPYDKVKKRIEATIKSHESILNQVVGETKVYLDGERENVRTRETNLGNLITDAMINETGADVAFMNGGGIRASISPGVITRGQIIAVLPFGNYVETRAYPGSVILEALEHSVKAYPEPKGSFLQVAGITFSIREGNTSGLRVENARVKGVPLDINKNYVVAMNNFLGAGGDNFTMLKSSPILAEYHSLDEILKKYIQKQVCISPEEEGRIQTYR